jgi:hypothetical protein
MPMPDAGSAPNTAAPVGVAATPREPVLRRHGVAVKLSLALLLFGWVLLATWLYYNARVPLQAAADTEARQVFANFFPLESNADGSFRWTGAASQVCFDQTGAIPRAVLSLDLLDSYAVPLGVTTVDLFVNQQQLARLPLSTQNRTYHFVLDATLAADNDCVLFVTDPALSPIDERWLGVPLVHIAIQPLASDQAIRPPLLQMLVNLVLAGLVLWGVRLLGLPDLVGVLLVVAISVGVLGLLLSGILLPGLGTIRNLIPLALGIGLLVGGVELARRIRMRLADHPHQLLLRDLLGLLFWSVALIGVTRLFQLLLGVSGMWPFKAGLDPAPTWWLGIPLALFGVWLWFVLRTLDRPGPGWLPPALVLAGSLLLPAVLKVSVRGWESLFSTFTNNPFEYISDVPRVGSDPLGFVREYISIAPTLALHSSTHPPGNVLLLWLVAQLVGPGPTPATFVAIGLSSMGPLAACWLGWQLAGRRIGLLAGAFAVVLPGHQIFSVTSMDAVFNGIFALGAVAFILALRPGASVRMALLSGLLIATGLFFSYAATQLAFFGIGVVLAAFWIRQAQQDNWRANASAVLRPALIAAGVIAGVYLVLGLVTGFNVVEGAIRATAINAAVMRGFTADAAARAFVPPNLSYYTRHLLANLLPFAWYLGPWGLLISGRLQSRLMRRAVARLRRAAWNM